ncbi:hypothetical protein Pla52o_34600 [Novipirellula galeiformis]|uniref:Uncharacterized protein n=1 Tax=Novipirellula galeiformis TaxID=2528004 RepID=A0A5C6CFU0_9BACT|nr:hypothetical protein [Novipirellula galeiformis]TWU22404.1 hypothetical protein Pla52o_34600 [Novipirellula galeiformis]
MRQLLTTAACCGVLFAGSVVGAQDIAGNSLSQAGDAVRNTAGQAQDAANNARNQVRNQVGSTASRANDAVNRVEGAASQDTNAGAQQRVGVNGVNVKGNVQSSQQLHSRHQGTHRGNLHYESNQRAGWDRGHAHGAQVYGGQVYGGQVYEGQVHYGGQAYGGQVYDSNGRHHGHHYGRSGHRHGKLGHRGHHSSHRYMATPSHGYGSQGYLSYGSSNHAMTTDTVYPLRHDASGREFICVHGQPVYFDSGTAQHGHHQDDRYQAGYGSYDEASGSQSTNGQAYPAEPQTGEMNRDGQSQTELDANTNADASLNGRANVDADANTNAEVNAAASVNENANANVEVDANRNQPPRAQDNLERAAETPALDQTEAGEAVDNAEKAIESQDVPANAEDALDDAPLDPAPL